MNHVQPSGGSSVSIERIRRDIEHLATLGATSSGGVSRTSFSPADRQMREWLRAECEQHGLRMRTDGIGNLFIRVDGLDAETDGPPVCTGSHLDTVPEGGRYDGIVGAIAALETLRVLAEERPALQRPVEAIIFADEEGSYHHLLGSTALVHSYPWEELRELQGRDGDRLVDALETMGWDPRAATRTALPAGSVHAFLELHIEQGPVLEERGTDIGIVTSIVGLGAGQIDIAGSQDHAGTTPMSMRRDPMQGAGAFLAQLAPTAAEVSDRAVATCGLMEIEPGGTNVVPGLVRLHMDFREPTLEGVTALEDAIAARAARAGHDYGVDVTYRRMSITDPVPMDRGLQELLGDVARECGLSVIDIPSGAGHDAQNMAQLAPTAMIFIPSDQGKSHSPREYSTWQSIEHGANVLLEAVRRLASG